MPTQIINCIFRRANLPLRGLTGGSSMLLDDWNSSGRLHTGKALILGDRWLDDSENVSSYQYT